MWGLRQGSGFRSGSSSALASPTIPCYAQGSTPMAHAAMTSMRGETLQACFVSRPRRQVVVTPPASRRLEALAASPDSSRSGASSSASTSAPSRPATRLNSSNKSSGAPSARPIPALSSVKVPHCGYHYDGAPRRFFEGWYWKVCTTPNVWPREVTMAHAPSVVHKLGLVCA